MMNLDIDLIKGIELIYLRYDHPSYLIFPDDPIKMIWEIIIIITLRWVCFVLLYEISFNNDNSDSPATSYAFNIECLEYLSFAYNIRSLEKC